MKILITGGGGYIGSHTAVELINAHYDVDIIDNLSNSSREVVKRIENITGSAIPLYIFDLENKEKLRELFQNHTYDAVIHFAGLKAVGESTEQPLRYYRTNIDSTLSLLEVMQEFGVKKMVFSSSATVYGSAPIPYEESMATGQGISNPYGRTKYMIEEILRDAANADATNHFSVLRYFNPIGAHPSGLIGEQPQGIPNNIMPYLTQVAIKKREELSIFGNDYDTTDGTCVRDFIHVVDLAKGHVAALTHSTPGFSAYNLGSGAGTSVLQLVHTFEKASGTPIPYHFAPRRPGDLPEYYADANKALRELRWKTEKTIEDACRDSWRWQSQNPNGYAA